jgi:hypothetical protein
VVSLVCRCASRIGTDDKSRPPGGRDWLRGAGRPILGVNGKRGYLQSGSAGLDYRKTACGPYFPVCATPFKAADPREWLPHLCDKTARKKAQRRQSSEAGASPSCAAAVNMSARSKRPIAEAVAIKQFALDDDQRRRLLIRERSLLHEALDPRHAARFSE